MARMIGHAFAPSSDTQNYIYALCFDVTFGPYRKIDCTDQIVPVDEAVDSYCAPSAAVTQKRPLHCAWFQSDLSWRYIFGKPGRIGMVIHRKAYLKHD